MSQHQCPGCDRTYRGTSPCCPVCWLRLPTKLPVGIADKHVSWRRRLAMAKSGHEQAAVEHIRTAIVAWLTDNPRVIHDRPK